MTLGKISRRSLLKATLATSGLALRPRRGKAQSVTVRPTDFYIKDVSPSYQDYTYRTPYKFGGRVVDRVTLLNVTCRVQTVDGRVGQGFGSMPLGNEWAFPSASMSYETTLGAMKALAGRISTITAGYPEAGHPISINHELEPAYLLAAAEVSAELHLDAPIPKLYTLVTASAFDAAIHDAFGKVHGLNCYHTYGPDLMDHDLAHYLTPDFAGEYGDKYVRQEPLPRVAIYHSVGALDPLVPSDLSHPLHDGLPELLGDWINYNGPTHFKIKLNGDDLRWDLERVVAIDRVVNETEQKRHDKDWMYSLDFNERCPNVEYVLEFCRKLKEQTPAGFERIQYLEQPTKRDLASDRANTMYEAAKLRPVIIDESLTGLNTLLLARRMGYTGVALKACKGQSQMVLMAAAAQQFGMFVCVQDLTCPGASFLQSAGIAAHVPGFGTVEANAREYVPAANEPWVAKFPGIFRITDGTIDTSVLTMPGLSAVE
jgi:L-alanine-DL-glutamate epimerase-like enolase superfamily enzyme